MVASCIFKELPLLCFWVSWFLFLVAGTVHVMMSLEPPQMSRKHLWGFFIFVYGVGPPFTKNPRWWSGFESARKNLKKLAKKSWHPARHMVLYLSAKRWDKRMTSKSQLEVKRKEPIDARKSGRNARDFRDAPSSVRNEKLRKNKAWQKTASVVK